MQKRNCNKISVTAWIGTNLIILSSVVFIYQNIKLGQVKRKIKNYRRIF